MQIRKNKIKVIYLHFFFCLNKLLVIVIVIIIKVIKQLKNINNNDNKY